MRCSGCGKDIPFAGEVCPHCQREKSGDQTATVVIGIGLLLGGTLGYAIGDFAGMLIGGFICATVFAIPATASAQKKAKRAPRVRIDDPSPTPRPTNSSNLASLNTVEVRLARLEDLRAKGVITTDEYLKRRQEIISLL